MKKHSLLSALLCLALIVSLAVPANGYTAGQPYQKDLRAWIKNDTRRRYVEMMLDYHVRTNRAVQNALSGGFSAVFLFDGCSDNMDDPTLSDLSFYRVSGICIVLRMNAAGEVEMAYFNDNASTIPDRPLEYGAWSIPEVGQVGPATVLDGTYQIYSVYHKGNYEALHVRTDYHDALLDAIYMTPEGYAPYRASEINIHTRTSNHTSGRGMWSAGCPLVGDGDSWQYWKFMEATYHRNYDSFETDNFVGTLTIDRQALRTEMYTLYKNPDAVDAILAATRKLQPRQYLEKCGHAESTEKTLRILLDTRLMTLPCSNGTDARSLSLGEVKAGQTLEVQGSIFNSLGNLWYETELAGQRCYVYAGHVEELNWFESLLVRLKK
ncbi:MAG: hypothetical protein SOW84_00215 [Candidatus Faecousia sp.]|nr:hypothetical protein [Candidatus Faecousia sp.]